jgi:hypothetical protein
MATRSLRWQLAGRAGLLFVRPRSVLMETPRVLIVMAAQWPRALIRAALRQAGYDALGATDLREALTYLREALTYPVEEEQRGPVRLIILDQSVLRDPDDKKVSGELVDKHAGALTLVLESAFHPSVEGVWQRVIRHPATIADIVETTRELLPLPPAAAHPID